ncbi:unnamed protein product [marine sediment metagenome]|uniref:Uncharacterized protein n=1 Tax=marine sediment metagenome TaxID=412755 RepID=X1N5R1_9ZZZZ
MSRKSFTVPTIGVGRADYSQSIELSVEPEVRSHQYRFNWTAEALLDTYEDPEDVHFTPLLFEDKAGNVLGYVPSDVKYLIYDVYVSGDYNALTIAALEKYSYPLVLTDPNAAYLETIAIVFGYGSAKIALSEGHICEPGRAYLVSLNQWCEKPTFTASFIVHAYTDWILG